MGIIGMHPGGNNDLDKITAAPEDVRKGKFYLDAEGDICSGNMPEIAGRTITPGASQQTVKGEGYLLDDINVPGFAMPAANLIKKGVTIDIYGRKVTGTFQGWVGDSGDLYINGANNAGFISSDVSFLQDRIQLGTSSPEFGASKAYTLVAGQKLVIVGSNIAGSYGSSGVGSNRYIYLYSDTPSGDVITSVNIEAVGISNGFSFTMPRTLTFKPYIAFPYATNGWRGTITRIYIQ